MANTPAFQAGDAGSIPVIPSGTQDSSVSCSLHEKGSDRLELPQRRDGTQADPRLRHRVDRHTKTPRISARGVFTYVVLRVALHAVDAECVWYTAHWWYLLELPYFLLERPRGLNWPAGSSFMSY